MAGAARSDRVERRVDDAEVGNAVVRSRDLNALFGQSDHAPLYAMVAENPREDSLRCRVLPFA